jgi:protein TonB
LLRSRFLGLSPKALGALSVSVGLHATPFVAWTDPPRAVSSAPEEVVGIDLLPDSADPSASNADTTIVPPAQPVHPTTRPSPAVSTRDDHPAHPRAPSPSGAASATDDDAPRFSMAVSAVSAVGTATGANAGVTAGSNTAPVPEGGTPLANLDSADVRARLERGTPPAYPPGARAAGVQGDVVLEIVVDPSGAVESARVIRGIGHGLDEAALRAASDFRFEPASKNGQPVRVRMLWPVRFRLD